MGKLCLEVLGNFDADRLLETLTKFSKTLICHTKVTFMINEDIIMINSYCLKFWKKKVLERILSNLGPFEVVKC